MRISLYRKAMHRRYTDGIQAVRTESGNGPV